MIKPLSLAVLVIALAGCKTDEDFWAEDIPDAESPAVLVTTAVYKDLAANCAYDQPQRDANIRPSVLYFSVPPRGDSYIAPQLTKSARSRIVIADAKVLKHVQSDPDHPQKLGGVFDPTTGERAQYFYADIEKLSANDTRVLAGWYLAPQVNASVRYRLILQNGAWRIQSREVLESY